MNAKYRDVCVQEQLNSYLENVYGGREVQIAFKGMFRYILAVPEWDASSLLGFLIIMQLIKWFESILYDGRILLCSFSPLLLQNSSSTSKLYFPYGKDEVFFRMFAYTENMLSKSTRNSSRVVENTSEVTLKGCPFKYSVISLTYSSSN